MTEREAIVVALEFLGDGDAAAAVDVLLAGLEADAPVSLPYGCATCGRRFGWHGELDGHVRRYAHRAELSSLGWAA